MPGILLSSDALIQGYGAALFAGALVLAAAAILVAIIMNARRVQSREEAGAMLL